MKSFLSAVFNKFKKVNAVVAAGAVAVEPFAPVIETIPGFGSAFGAVLQGILIAEQLISPPNSGPAKKAVATAVVNSVQPGLDPTVLSNSIDMLVAMINHLSTGVPAPVAP